MALAKSKWFGAAVVAMALAGAFALVGGRGNAQQSADPAAATRDSLAIGPATRSDDDWNYRGFTIDDSRVVSLTNPLQVKAATRSQIDIVCAVGLPDEILTFVKGIPLALAPSGVMPEGSPGFYGGKALGVSISTGIVNVEHRPVLLHEFMHAYHDQRIERGFDNPEILAFYQRAKSIDAYSQTSHMMENQSEFFACSATTYLFGITGQEPFKRQKVKDNQPDAFEHLKAIFGPSAGGYEGSLTR